MAWLLVIASIHLLIVLAKSDPTVRRVSDSSSSQQEQYTKCGFSSEVNFETWFEQLFTNSPVLFPRTDTELASICSTAKANGCKVRVRGAGHSEDGLVMQKLDELEYDVVVVHLKDYVPSDPSWNGVLDTNTNTVKVPTGWSTLQLMALIRPQGYLTRTNTAGRLFSVGGAYLNPSVIGSVQDESRYAAQVKSVRVMDANGGITEYSGSDVVDFRGSAGLLGIVTAVEIDVVPDQGLTMTRSTYSGSFSDMEGFRNFVANEYSLHDAIEFFYHIYDDAVDALEIDYTGGSPIDPTTTQDYYTEQLNMFPDLAYEGGLRSGAAAFSELLAGFIEGNRPIAKLVAQFGRVFANNEFDVAAEMPRDGYFLPIASIPRFQLLSLNIKCASDCVDETVDWFEISRTFLQNVKDEKDSDWYPNLPLEWRSFSVQPAEMTLEHLEPGKYIGVELATLRVGDDGLEYSQFFYQLEQLWLESFPNAKIHHGKAWGMDDLDGYGRSSQDKVQFQSDSMLDSIYSPSVREAFVAKMQQYDPSGTFAAGSLLRQLGLTVNKFTPK